MTAEDRPATRFDEAELLNPNAVAVRVPSLGDVELRSGPRAVRAPRDDLRSGVVIVWLALAIVAGAAIAVLWWTFR